MASNKYLLFLITLSLTILGNQSFDDNLKDDIFAIYTNAALIVRNITYEKVDPKKITFYLFTRGKPKQELVLVDPEHPPKELKGNETIVFLIHGWTGSRTDEWYDNLTDTFLQSPNGNYKVIQVDWKEPANQFYVVSSYNTKEVGQFIGKFLANLHRNLSIPLERILLVGHSLGAQVSGFAGKTVYNLTKQRLPRIVGLDPAGPLFDVRPNDERLNSTDAKIVHVIHTDGGTFGLKFKCGTIDFYPNGGSDQNGCKRIDILNVTSITEAVMCDHRRAHQYFIEAATSTDTFIGKKCKDWSLFERGACEEIEAAMGDVQTNLEGDFYLTTNSEPPFNRRDDELKNKTSIPLKILSKITKNVHFLEIN